MTVTAATGLFIYGMVNAGDGGWADLGTLGPVAAAIVLAAACSWSSNASSRLPYYA